MSYVVKDVLDMVAEEEEQYYKNLEKNLKKAIRKARISEAISISAFYALLVSAGGMIIVIATKAPVGAGIPSVVGGILGILRYRYEQKNDEKLRDIKREARYAKEKLEELKMQKQAKRRTV